MQNCSTIVTEKALGVLWGIYNMSKPEGTGRIMIECPSTIFHLYVRNEAELSKIEIFMGNIRKVKRLNIIDIYNWCNRQGIMYDTHFNYHKEFSLWKNIKWYFKYSSEKLKYQFAYTIV